MMRLRKVMKRSALSAPRYSIKRRSPLFSILEIMESEARLAGSRRVGVLLLGA
jgi:hypothetical protein